MLSILVHVRFESLRQTQEHHHLEVMTTQTGAERCEIVNTRPPREKRRSTGAVTFLISTTEFYYFTSRSSRNVKMIADLGRN